MRWPNVNGTYVELFVRWNMDQPWRPDPLAPSAIKEGPGKKTRSHWDLSLPFSLPSGVPVSTHKKPPPRVDSIFNQANGHSSRLSPSIWRGTIPALSPLYLANRPFTTSLLTLE